MPLRSTYYHPGIITDAQCCHRNLLMVPMEDKARLTILIDPAKKKAFEALCLAQDTTASQKVRQLIRHYLEQHGIQYGAAATKTRPG